jgi:DNA replication and repair protein RecF
MADDVLDALDTSLADEGARLVGRRGALLEDIRPHVEAVHESLAGAGSRFRLRYRTQVKGDSHGERAAVLGLRLREGRRRERERKTVLVGPHHDDVEILVDEQSARAFGSQGQLRTVVLALKMAELIAAQKRGCLPLFLIDDVGSELDGQRKDRLIGVLSDLGGQVFATTTDPDHLRALPAERTAFRQVDAGRIC